MNRKRGNESIIQFGRGRPLSAEALKAIGRAVISKNPATDWTKGRVLTMGLSVLVLIWGLGGIFDLVVLDPGEGLNKQGLVIEEAESGTDGDTKVAAGANTMERLRNDLFKVLKPTKNNTKKQPRTNPVELLRLLELQGVLGGENPRALVFYKRTKKTVTVSVGDDLGEFEVMEIREKSVILKWRDELFELSL
ncbi:MAG: hypothetical protein KAH56_05025 [Candidatus Krumholzibacteria bacterium]|nr:hypothetical protein [Candidatus Krumholzibacteria bacterium]